MDHLATFASSWTSTCTPVLKWAVPNFYDKTPFDWYNMWSIAAPLPLILLQIHLLLRYNPRTTWLLRASLAPIITLLCLRFSFAHYYTFTGDAQLDGRGQHMNLALGCGAACMIVWAWGWGLRIDRPKLKIQPGYSRKAESRSDKGTGDRNKHVVDDLPVFFPGTYIPLELDLLSNLRGSGWEHGLRCGVPALPVPKRTLQDRRRWFIKNMPPCIFYYLIYDLVFFLIQDKRFNVHAGTIRGGSIWDCTYGAFGAAGPYFICIAYASAFVCQMYLNHVLVAAVAIGLFNDMPQRWEPQPFKCPWFPTSVHDFWSNRWHQYLRGCFMTLGFWPVRAIVEPLAGRRIATYAAIVGTFAASGIIHDIGSATLAPTSGWGFTKVSLFFIVQPVAIFGEQLWHHFTGYKVRGLLGWLWALSWLTLTSPLLFDIWNRGGLLAAENMTFNITLRPATAFLDWWEHKFNGGQIKISAHAQKP